MLFLNVTYKLYCNIFLLHKQTYYQSPRGKLDSSGRASSYKSPTASIDHSCDVSHAIPRESIITALQGEYLLVVSAERQNDLPSPLVHYWGRVTL